MNPALWEVELPEVAARDERLDEIERQSATLKRAFAAQLQSDPELSRAAVSFGDSKTEPKYRWFKFREAFSPHLVQTNLATLSARGHVFDPFAGSGTALFAAAEIGWDASGIEVLPVGRFLVEARQTAVSLVPDEWARVRFWHNTKPWNFARSRVELGEMKITEGAYPAETKRAIESYLGALESESERVARVLKLALVCVLEAISYTRKDGQYLRWDARAGRRVGARPFNKGPIPAFDGAIEAKLAQMMNDCCAGQSLSLFPQEPQNLAGQIELHAGSCLDLLPRIETASFDAILTSPPYCNRYDYTRTYALELALLGVSGAELIELRQQMLSCTVENRAKDLLSHNPPWSAALDAVTECEVLQTILDYLDKERAAGNLNNAGIARMVRGYFSEMACVIQECARVLKPGAPLWMVNDNVRYAGASIPVDLILSFIAERVGFEIEKIAVLPGGKGNSSQQMGAHGREALRKCVYVWRKI